MGPIQEVATREIRVRMRTRAFQVSTVLVVVLAIAASVASAVVDTGGDEVERVDVGVVGPGAEGLVEELERLPRDAIVVDITRFDRTDAAQGALLDGQVDVVVRDGRDLVWNERIDVDLLNLVDALWLQAHYASEGVTPPTPLGQEVVEPTDDDEEGISVAVAMVGVIGSFALIQTWGSLVAMGVIEEKSTRVIEVLLSHLTPGQLITGKVLGLGLLAMTQAVIVVFGLFGALLLTDSGEVPSTTWRAVGFLVLAIGGGFAFYAVAFAAAGSLVSRTEDAQQVLLPVGLPLLLGYLFGVGAVSNPDNAIAVILSFVPFTIPTVMPLRLAGGGMDWWEVVLSFGILLGSTAWLARLAGRLYHVSLLHAGSRIPWRRAVGIMVGR